MSLYQLIYNLGWRGLFLKFQSSPHLVLSVRRTLLRVVKGWVQVEFRPELHSDEMHISRPRSPTMEPKRTQIQFQTQLKLHSEK